MIRPQSLWPFPYDEYKKINPGCKNILTVEMNTGQMIDDVKIAVADRQKVHFYGRQGGMIPTPQEIVDKCLEILKG